MTKATPTPSDRQDQVSSVWTAPVPPAHLKTVPGNRDDESQYESSMCDDTQFLLLIGVWPYPAFLRRVATDLHPEREEQIASTTIMAFPQSLIKYWKWGAIVKLSRIRQFR